MLISLESPTGGQRSVGAVGKAKEVLGYGHRLVDATVCSPSCRVKFMPDYKFVHFNKNYKTKQ